MKVGDSEKSPKFNFNVRFRTFPLNVGLFSKSTFTCILTVVDKFLICVDGYWEKYYIGRQYIISQYIEAPLRTVLKSTATLGVHEFKNILNCACGSWKKSYIELQSMDSSYMEAQYQKFFNIHLHLMLRVFHTIPRMSEKWFFFSVNKRLAHMSSVLFWGMEMFRTASPFKSNYFGSRLDLSFHRRSNFPASTILGSVTMYTINFQSNCI